MQVRKIVFTVLLIIAVFSSFAAAEEMLRDEWYVIEQEGVPNGYGHDQYLRTENGYYYSSFFELNLDFMGTPFVHFEHIELWVDEQFRLTRALSLANSDGAESRHEAEFIYDEAQTQIKITSLDTTGEEKEKTLTLEGERPVYTAATFLDSLLTKNEFAIGQNHTFEIWDFGETKTMRLEIGEKQSIVYGGEEITVYTVYQDIGPLQATELIDASGNSYYGESLGGSLVITKVQPDEIPELQTMAADVLIVPGNMAVRFPYRTDASLITVQWEDIPLADFVFTDNRQQISKVLSEFSVQLAIERDQRDFSGKMELPVVDPMFAPYLADGDYITPSTPDAQNLAKEILNGEKDAWRGAQLILDWVYHNITSKLVARTLTTEEILMDRAGKCSEYAVLYAALARAAGLPTRVVLGERYMGNMWVAHLWNEIWVGEWIAVDASHNQMAPDALLIKFIHSDTLMGTQDIRLGLVKKLAITIDELQSTSTQDMPEFVTGRQGQKYYNAEYFCEIEIPHGWIAVEAEDQGFPLLIMEDPRDSNFAAMFVMLSVPLGSTAEQLMAARVMSMPSLLPDFSLQLETSGLVAGEPGATARWEFGSEPRLIQENQILIKEDVAYLFVFTALEETWKTYEPLIEEITGQFKSYL